MLPPPSTVQRWFGLNASQDEKKAFDGECRENYEHALKSVGPDQMLLPAFESHDKDIENADTISQPLLAEVKEAQKKDAKHGAETLLSIILLLDQMPRNIYRDPAGLKAVYNHYDRLALSLLYSSMRLDPSPVEHEGYRIMPIYNGWFILPLMHSEHIPSHELWREKMLKWQGELERTHGPGFTKHIENGLGYAEKHLQPLQRFGRYPHRNEALERRNTKEEEDFLKTADTFGVKQKQTNGDATLHDKSEL